MKIKKTMGIDLSISKCNSRVGEIRRSRGIPGAKGRWGDGEMGRWGDGEMGRWGDGAGYSKMYNDWLL
jgi:hypothetical protein